MGTSASNSGPGNQSSMISFDPPWLFENQPSDQSNETIDDNLAEFETVQPLDIFVSSDILLSKRFSSTRRNLKKSFSSESKECSIARSLGYYSKNGWGGANSIVKNRFRTTVLAGSKLVGIFVQISHSSQQQSPKINLLIDDLNRYDNWTDWERVLSRFIVQQGGSLDEELCRMSIFNSLSDMVRAFPDSNPVSLSEENIRFILERFLIYEIESRYYNDNGKYIETKCDVNSFSDHCNEIRYYITAKVNLVCNSENHHLMSENYINLENTITSVLSEVFFIFEEACNE